MSGPAWWLLLLAFLAGAGLARWGARPLAQGLRALADVARRLGQGELGARAKEGGPPDLAVVARALNRLAEGVREERARAEAERALREEMLAAMTDGVALVDPHDGVVHANAALALALGRPGRPAGGESFGAWCRAPELVEFVAEARADGGHRQREIRLRGPLDRTLEAAATLLRGGSLLLVVRDLTPLKRLERVRRDFVANVSHELKTPLTSILGYAETLLDGGLEDAERRRGFVVTISEQATRLKAIVDDLLVLSELERPDAALALSPVDLAKSARSVTAALIPRATKDGLTLTCDAPAEGVIVLGDRVRLEQLLFNLLDNALKYTECGGVAVRLWRADREALLVVEDTGPGIPEGELPRIFERFYRVDAARSREVPGTGLGLAIVRHIVELHGGALEVRNRPSGGASFTVRLPCAR